MSVSSGPTRFDTDELHRAKLTPAARTAGSTSSMRRQPASRTTRYAGMRSEKKRQLAADHGREVARGGRRRRGRGSGATRPPSVVTGMPIEPKATGAVLATSASTAAVTGSKPRPASIDALIATGAPKPAMPSMSAPKQKATSRHLDAPVLGEPGERAADDVEVAARDGEVVEEDGVQDAPS